MGQDPVSVPTDAEIAAQARLQEARTLVCAFASGKPSTADRERINAWRQRGAAHEAAWQAACREWQTVGQLAAATPLAPQPLPARVTSRTASPARRAFLGGAVTAAGALGVAMVVRPPWNLWPSWSELGADYRTATGEQREVPLGGGVRLALNTQTSVTVAAGNAGVDLRLLAGEAVLSATGDTPCVLRAEQGQIHTRDGDVEVRSVAGEPVRVRCHRGSAEVVHPGGTLVLRQGQQLDYDAARIAASSQADAAAASWREGMLVFRDAPLARVVAEINRYRPGHVFLRNPGLAERRLSAHFSIHALDEALTHIERLYNVSASRLPGNIVVLS